MEIDVSNLRQTILDYPTQLKVGAAAAKEAQLSQKNFSNLVICAMGGSAMAGDLLVDYLNHTDELKLPINFCRSYEIGQFVTKKSLVFVCSYSGTTAETLCAMNAAMKAGASVVAFSAGGDMEKIAKEKKLLHINITIKDKTIQQRYGLTYIFAAMQAVLANSQLIAKISKYPSFDVRESEIYGEELAQKIKGRTPVVYASNRFEAMARCWKAKINENGKTPAFWNVFPELNHNEMVGFTNPQAPFFAVMLQDKDDQEEIKKRMKLTASLYKDKGVESEIVKIQGKTYLEKMLRTLVLGDWVSYYLALEYGQDPTPVEMVVVLKNLLKTK